MVRPPTLVISKVAGLREAFAQRGLTGSWLEWTTAPSAADLAKCEVLVGEPAVIAPMLEGCSSLRWVQSTFAGCNQLLDQPRRDFVTTRLAGSFGPDMAEYTMLHILAQERRYTYQLELQRQKQWLAARGEEGTQGGAAYRRLGSLTLGVLGLGDIGSRIAASAHHGFGMRVVGWRRDGAPRASDTAAGVSQVYGGTSTLSEFLAQADYYVSVMPSTPATRGLLDGDALAPCAARKPALINVGRGDLLTEATILTALERGWLSHFVGDVFAPEPLPTTSALWAHEHVTVTPHNSAVTQPSDVVDAFATNLERYEAGGVEALTHVFDWEAGY